LEQNLKPQDYFPVADGVTTGQKTDFLISAPKIFFSSNNIFMRYLKKTAGRQVILRHNLIEYINFFSSKN